jgi:hypothetical protein
MRAIFSSFFAFTVIGCVAARSSQPAPTASTVCGPLTEVCPPDGGEGCDMDWATAQDPATWCTSGKSGNETYETGALSVAIASHCDGLDIVELGYPDAVVSYFYDPQTGVLVGMSGGSPEGYGCFGRAPPVEDCADAGGFTSVNCASVDSGVAKTGGSGVSVP